MISYTIRRHRAQKPTRAAITAGHSTAYHHFAGKERLDVHLLKPSRLEVVQEQLQDDMCDADIADQAR